MVGGLGVLGPGSRLGSLCSLCLGGGGLWPFLGVFLFLGVGGWRVGFVNEDLGLEFEVGLGLGLWVKGGSYLYTFYVVV